MKLRTFVARDMREALSNVRSEMGDEAVIVASEKTKSGGVLVRAALDEPEPEEDAVAEPQAASEPQQVEATASMVQSLEDSYRSGLMSLLRRGPAGAALPSKPFHRAELLTLLRTHRLPDALAHDLAKLAEDSGLKDMTLALASALDKRMRTQPINLQSAGAMLLLGPPGAGKTAVAAKIAAHARMANREALLIATDGEGAGAIARLETFGEHLGTPVSVSENAEDLAQSVNAARESNALAIIDTAGFDLRKVKSRTAFQGLAMIGGVEAIGIVSAVGDAEETGEIVIAIGSLGAQRVIVTGLDLARRLGGVVAAACSGLALAHVTRSPFVAGGLETLTPISLSRALMSEKQADQGSAQ